MLSLANYQQANIATWLNLAAQGFTNAQVASYWTSNSYRGGDSATATINGLARALEMAAKSPP